MSDDGALERRFERALREAVTRRTMLERGAAGALLYIDEKRVSLKRFQAKYDNQAATCTWCPTGWPPS